MEQKPFHYDGSFHGEQQASGAAVPEAFEVTEEMRSSIGKNPYSLETSE